MRVFWGGNKQMCLKKEKKKFLNWWVEIDSDIINSLMIKLSKSGNLRIKLIIYWLIFFL